MILLQYKVTTRVFCSEDNYACHIDEAVSKLTYLIPWSLIGHVLFLIADPRYMKPLYPCLIKEQAS